MRSYANQRRSPHAMTKVKLALKAPAEFSAMSLHEKNSYLQGLSNQVAIARGIQNPEPLDREALSRLRRFYMRRKPNELELEKIADPLLRSAMQSLADTIHLGEIKNHILHEAPANCNAITIVPADDAQLSFFPADLHDAPLKDDVNLMDVAPFSLSKTIRDGSIRYELPDAVITIEGGATVGLVTVYDYDIFIHMVSQLSAQMRQYRIDMEKGLRPSLPPRVFRPNASQILRYCQREQGGKQYADLEKALDRLQATRYKITNLTDTQKRRASVEAFTLIGRYKVVSRTNTDTIDEVEIEIPEWVYNGVVTSPGNRPSILTLNPDYFTITRPLAKFIYRIARKACGTHGFAVYGFDTLYQRSGSAGPYRKFRDTLLKLVEACKTDPLPDFDIEIVTGKGNADQLRMTSRNKTLTMKDAA